MSSPGADQRQAAHRTLTRILTIIGIVTFAATLFVRAVDPVIPKIAADLAIDAGTTALLATAFALPYALTQPLLGPIADMVGKTRMMTVSLMICALAGLAGAFAPNFSTLLATRVVSGIAAGGVFPAAMAAVSDLVPVRERQVALGRLIASAITGQILGASCAGLVGDVIGWRAVFVLIGTLGLAAAVVAQFGLRGITPVREVRFDFRAVPASYRAILANPRAKICFGAVFLEGIAVFGIFPYVALLLLAEGETRAAIAGIVIAGFGAGGVIYALTVSKLLGRLGEARLMLSGGAVATIALAGVGLASSWQLEVLAFAGMGLGFYMLHGSIQVFVTELAPTARAAALSLHSSSFFLGQALGPVVYGLALPRVGATAAILGGAAMVAAIAVACARLLPHRRVD